MEAALMPKKIGSYQISSKVLNTSVPVLTFYQESTSTRAKGTKPNLLKTNPYVLRKSIRQKLSFNLGRFNSVFVHPQGHDKLLNDCPGYAPTYASLQNEVRSKFTGKLKDGGASLGLTLATYKGSRDMITSRLMKTSETLDDALAYLRGNPQALRRIRKRKQPLAGQFLEYEFGWLPLMSDIEAAMHTVIQHAAVGEWVKVSGKKFLTATQVVQDDRNGRSSIEYEGALRLSYSALVVVSNPNLWLAERAGLLNVAAMVWDAVPWSFVVNFFTNTGQLVNSLTDRLGLTISGESMTQKQLYWTHGRMEDHYFGSSTTLTYFHKRQIRVLDHQPSQSFEWKNPELSWETACIAAALVTQKFSKINRLIGFI